jgi:hypothetical protein
MNGAQQMKVGEAVERLSENAGAASADLQAQDERPRRPQAESAAPRFERGRGLEVDLRRIEHEGRAAADGPAFIEPRTEPRRLVAWSE